MTHLVPPTLARRDLLKGAGALVVTIAIALLLLLLGCVAVVVRPWVTFAIAIVVLWAPHYSHWHGWSAVHR